MTALVLAALAISAVVTPAVAQSDDDSGFTALMPQDDGGVDWTQLAEEVVISVRASAAAAIEDAQRAAGLREPRPTAEAARRDLQTIINGNSTTIATWVNAQGLRPTMSDDTLAVNLSVDGNTSTLFVLGNHGPDEWSGVRARNQTSRTVDATVTLTEDAATNADTELATALDGFVANNRSVQSDAAREFVARLTGRYGRQVDSSLEVLE